MKRVVSTLDKVEKDLSALEEERKRYNDAAAERLAASVGKSPGRGLPGADSGPGRREGQLGR